MQQITRGIFYEDSYLGVTLGALVFPHGVVLIDAPLRSEDARSWRSALINQRGGPNRLMISLDAHPDRTLGTRALDCTIVAHQKTAQVFRNRPMIFKGQSTESGAEWESYADAIGMRWISPDITFTESMFLNWGGAEVLLEHRPGPTPGSIWVTISDARVVFVGDTVLKNQPPYLAYAELESWHESLDLLLKEYRDYTVISGRNGPVSTAEIRAQQRILNEITEALEKLARRNASPEDTDSQVQPLLARYKSAHEQRERYAQRLRYGLYHCFTRRYRASNIFGQTEVVDEAQ